MGDFLKEIFDAANSRIRSPFVGSIILVFLTLNWKPVFYLLFADKPARTRFLYFEANTSDASLYWTPIAGGVVLAFLMPWLRLFGAWIASVPTRRLRNRQHREVVARQVYELEQSALLDDAKAKAEEARERRAIEAEKRRQELSKLGNAQVESEILAQREQDGVQDEPLALVPERALLLLKGVASGEQGLITAYEYNDRPSVHVDGQEISVKSRREFLDLLADLEQLTEFGLTSKEDSGKWKVTREGYLYLDTVSEE